MKSIKKLSLLVLCLILGVFTLTGCAKTAVEEEADAQAALRETNVASVDAYVENNFCAILTGTNSDALAAYLASGQVLSSITFDNDFLMRWQAFEAKHGACVSASLLETMEKHGEYTSRVLMTGEDGSQMAMTIEFDSQVRPLKTSLTDYSDDASQSLGAKMGNAAGNIVVGLLVVFAILILLSFIISSFTLINKAATKKPAPAAVAAPKAAPAAPKAAPAPVVTDDTELIAVIAAAIAAAEGTSTDGFVVRSIRRLDSNKWR